MKQCASLCKNKTCCNLSENPVNSEAVIALMQENWPLFMTFKESTWPLDMHQEPFREPIWPLNLRQEQFKEEFSCADGTWYE